MGSEDYSAEEGEPYMWMDSVQKKRKRKRRFSDEQIRSLESMFERQEKLEPDRKLQLAGELGLQPRQVSIWFQNRRARWKTKQLEREHGALRAEYDALLSSFESLKREKQILTQQVQMLGELLEEPPEPRNGDREPNSGGGEGQRPSPPVAGNTFSKEEPELYTGDVSASAEQLLGFQPSWPSDQFSDSSQWWEFWPTE